MVFFKKIFFKLTESKIYSIDDGLRFWQERVLNRILFFAFILGFPVLIPSFILSIVQGFYTVAVVDMCIYIIVVLLFFMKKIPYSIRAFTFIFLSFLLGIVLLSVLKESGAGAVWLFFAPVLTAILIGSKASIVALFLNFLIILISGGMIYSSYSVPAESLNFLFRWGVIGLNFMLLNILSTVSIPAVFMGLQSSIQAQKTSRMKYLRIFNNILDVYFEISLDGTILEITPSAAGFFETDYKELIGRSIFDFSSTDLKDFMSIVREEGSVENYEDWIETEKGRQRFISLKARLIKDDPGRNPSIIGLIRDTTVLKKVEKEKKALEERLIRSEKMETLGLLAGGVAHDLNNILSAIIAYPDMMLSELDDENPHKVYLKAMMESGEKAAAILDDLLSLARRGIIIRDTLDLNLVISKFISSPECKNLISNHPNTHLKMLLNAESSNVLGSAFHLHKLIMNLVSNAVESQSNGGIVSIQTSTLYDYEGDTDLGPIPLNDYIVLKVEDQGDGIRPEDLSKIFEPFFTRKVMGRSGTGLGMAVVWGTVQDHKGFINITSEIELGTSIQIYLPLSRSTSRSSDENWSMEDFLGKGEIVLIVDDQEEQREINSLLLKKLLYNTLTVPSGEAAIELLKEKKIDLVLMDMIMDPGINGIETFMKIKKNNPSQKVILLSGYAENTKVDEALELGVKDFLKKPCTLKQLSRSIRKVLDS
ncbi:MAG: response regulator [Spirochaetales bacterium]|nr:response regulator [Spirochaetales bacterium]